ncbi:MAG: DMT family transporter [Pseudomonadota bacterium]
MSAPSLDQAKNIHIKLITMALIWGSSYPMGRVLAQYEVPSLIVFSRLVLAFLFLIAFARWRGELKWAITKNQIALFFLLGFSGFCVHNYLLFKALEYTEASTGAVINGAIPLIVVMLDYVFFRRTVRALALFGIMVGIVGTAVVVTHGDWAFVLSKGLGFGEFLFLVAICGWAVYTIAARPLFATVSPIMITAYTCLTGAILLSPAALSTLPAAGQLISDWPT